MSDPDEVAEVIILMPTRFAHKLETHVPGSVVVTAGCGHKAFMAPTTVAFLADGPHPNARTVCTTCAEPGLFSNPDVQKRLMPGTRAEAESALGVGGADQLLALARDLGFQ